MKVIKDLFKPYEVAFVTPGDLLKEVGISEVELAEIFLQDECSKSISKSCANTECPYNFVNGLDSD